MPDSDRETETEPRRSAPVRDVPGSEGTSQISADTCKDSPSTSSSEQPPQPRSTGIDEHMEEFARQVKEEQKNVAQYIARCSSHKTELYQLMAFYTVFQGVVFNTVATSPKLTCRTSAFPFVLSSLAFIAILVGVHYKLTDYNFDKRKRINSEHLVQYVQDKMKLLKDKRDKFDFKKHPMNAEKLAKKLEEDEKSRRKFWLAVNAFLVSFSVTNLAFCIVLRCWA